MDDLISRQAAIDELSFGKEMLSRVLDGIDVVSTDREKYSWGLGLIESNIYDIEELPSVNQWIPCSERLPEADGLYLVTERRTEWNGKKYNSCGIVLFSQGEWRAYDVVAWMPLPEPARLEEPND